MNDSTTELQNLLSQARQKIYMTHLKAGASAGLRLGAQIALGIALARLLAAFVLPPTQRPIFWLLIVAAVPLVFALVGLLLQLSKRPSFKETAERLDLALKNDNRIATALEFSRQEHPTPFMLAAINDGIARIHALYRARPVLPAVRWQWPRVASYVASAAVLVAVSPFVSRPPAGPAAGESQRIAASGPGRDVRLNATTQRNTERPRDAQKNILAAAARDQGKADSLAQESQPPATGLNNSKAGAPAGKSAAANRSAGSAGTSSSGLDGQASTSNMRQRQAKSATPKNSKPQAGKSDEKQDAAKGGSAGGAGASGQMQAVSQNGREQNVPDHANVDELDGDLQDADENKSSPSNGSLQPMPTDRTPSPSRELGLPGNKGLGGTGRGGPTPPKKSRGTGSMLLGVATPDFVPGQMRPGPSRVTHDEAPAQTVAGAAEVPAPAEARVADETLQDRFDPEERMTDALLKYFKALHATSSDKTADATGK